MVGKDARMIWDWRKCLLRLRGRMTDWMNDCQPEFGCWLDMVACMPLSWRQNLIFLGHRIASGKTASLSLQASLWAGGHGLLLPYSTLIYMHPQKEHLMIFSYLFGLCLFQKKPQAFLAVSGFARCNSVLHVKLPWTCMAGAQGWHARYRAFS